VKRKTPGILVAFVLPALFGVYPIFFDERFRGGSPHPSGPFGWVLFIFPRFGLVPILGNIMKTGGFKS
jgi:hypothetical protein